MNIKDLKNLPIIYKCDKYHIFDNSGKAVIVVPSYQQLLNANLCIIKESDCKERLPDDIFFALILEHSRIKAQINKYYSHLELLKKIKMLDEEFDKEKQAYAPLIELIEKMQNILIEKNNEIKKLNKTIKDQSKLQASAKTIEELSVEIANKNQELKIINQNIENNKEQYKNLQLQIESANKTIKSKEEKLRELEFNIENSKNYEAQLLEEFTKKEEELNKRERQLKEKENRFAEYEIKQGNIEKEIEARTKELKILNDEIQSQIQYKENLNQDKEKLIKEIDSYKQIGDEVKIKVKEQIEEAKSNAAEFISKMMFLPQNNTASTANRSYSKSPLKLGIKIEDENPRQVSNYKQALQLIGENLANIGANKELAIHFATLLYSAFLKNTPLILAGPGGSHIANAFSAVIYGKTADIIDCSIPYENFNEDELKNASVVIVKNPFSSPWIDKLPELASNHADNFFILVTPFTEDLQIEPKSLFNYFLPVFTDILMESVNSSKLHTAIIDKANFDISNDKTKFELSAVNHHTTCLQAINASLIAKTNIIKLTDTMNTIENAVRYEYLFVLLPYFIITGNEKHLKETIEKNPKIPVNNEISKYILKYLENSK